MEKQRQPLPPKIPAKRASVGAPDLRYRFKTSGSNTPPVRSVQQRTVKPVEVPKSKKPETPKVRSLSSSGLVRSKSKLSRVVLSVDRPSVAELSDSAYRANDRIEEVAKQAWHYAKAYTWWIAGVFAVILAGILIGIILSSYAGIRGQQNSGASAFPDSVSRDVLIPSGDAYKLDIKTVKHTKSTGVISYSIDYINGTRVFVNQQLYPEQFTNDPNAFSQMIAGMNSYGEAPAEQDKLYLTRPAELKGKQAVVSKVDKYLLFIKPSKDFTPAEASEFIASLETTSYDFPK